MFKAIPGNHNYTISLFGEMKCVESTDGANNKEECTPPVINGKVKIEMYGNIQELDLVWLSLIAHYEINLPKEFRPYLNTITFLDCNLLIFRHSLSKKIMVFKRPMEIEGYRIVPGFTHLAVDKFGNVIEVNTNKPIGKRYHGRKKDYPMIWCYNPDRNMFRMVPIHRLVALAWVPNNDFIDKPLVNHKDGDKQNYYYKNLEWVSNSENSTHAHDNGLILHTIRCKVKNIHTGEITEFKTMHQACKFMGIGFRTAPKMLKYPENYLIANKYQVRVQNDNRPWHEGSFEEDNIPRPRKSRFNIILKYPDGKIKEYNGTRDLIRDLSLWNLSKGFSDLIKEINKRYPEIEVTFTDNYQNGPVQAYHIPTATITDGESIKDLSRKLNLHHGIILSRLKTSETFRIRDYAFRFKSDKPWDTNFVTTESSPVCILATNQFTKEKIEFDSLRKTADYFRVSRDSVTNRIGSDKTLRDWKLELKHKCDIL